MTQTEFVELVRDMRFAQIEYFKNRTQSSLNCAKALEKRVDHHLAGQPIYQQSQLF